MDSVYLLDSPFVGRSVELDFAREMLDSAKDGRGSVMVVTGEPGIGKSRLVREIEDLASPSGFFVAIGQNYPGSGTPSAWAWTQIIRQFRASRCFEAISKEPHTYAGHQSNLIDDILSFDEGTDEDRFDDRESARFHRFDAISQFISRASDLTPALIVLEDLQQADEQTLLLVEFLAQQIGDMHLLLVATVRTEAIAKENTLTLVMANLNRLNSYHRLALHRLDRDDVKHYLELVNVATINQEMERDTEDLIYRRTQGLPFLVIEIVKSMLAGGSPSDTPDSVRETIESRFMQLSKVCRTVLQRAAIFGRAFSLDDLQLLVSRDATTLVESLDDAVSIGFIECEPDSTDRYRFSHELFGECILESLRASEKLELHAKVADGHIERYGDTADDHAAKILAHLLQARPLADGDLIVRFALHAGNKALKELALENARRYYSAGLEALKEHEKSRRRADMLIGLAESGKDRSDSCSRIREAYEIYESLDDRESAISAASFDAHASLMHEDITCLYDRALNLSPLPAYEARIRVNRARFRLSHQRDFEGMQRDIDRAREIAVSLRDPQLIVRVLAAAVWIESREIKKPDRVLEFVNEAERYASRVGYNTHMEAIWDGAFWVYEQRAESEKALSYALRALESSRITRYHHRSNLNAIGFLHVQMGKWVDARAYFSESMALGLERFCWSVMILAFIELDTGNADAAKKLLDELYGQLSSSNNPASYESLCAFVMTALARQFHLDDRWIFLAETKMQSARESVVIHPYTAEQLHRAEACVACAKGDIPAAKIAYEYLRDTNIRYPEMLHIGRIAAFAGYIDEAITWFRTGRDKCRTGGYAPTVAWSDYELSKLLSGQNGRYPADEVIAGLEEARAICLDLGMRFLDEKVATLADSIGYRFEDLPSVHHPDSSAINNLQITSLSRRENEVLGLLADGKTNKEIASVLYISPKTVHNHISHIFAKLDVGNRTEAAKYAIEMGIREPRISSIMKTN